MDGHMLVEVLFMMVILKLPVVYLCLVVWWAVRAEPRPLEGAAALAVPADPGPCPWHRGRRPGGRGLRPLPRGGSPRYRATRRARAAR